MDGTVLSKNTRSVTLAPNTSPKGLFGRHSRAACTAAPAVEAIVVDKIHDRRTTLLQHRLFRTLKRSLRYPKPTSGGAPNLTAEGYAVTLTSDRFRSRRHGSSLDGNEHFEDNYFDLLPGVGRTVEVSTKLSRDEFDRLLRITHLQQTR